MTKTMENLIYCGLLLLGIALFSVAIYHYIQTKKLLHNGIRTTAEVVQNNSVRDEKDGSFLYQPLLEYTVKGQAFTMVSNFRSNPPAYKLGDKVDIIVAADNANHTRIVSYWGLYLAPIILMVFALPLLVVCGGFFLFKAGIL